MVYCILPFCKHRGSKNGLSYFQVTATRRDLWLRAIGREGQNVNEKSTICSDHFKPEDFLFLKGKKFLKKGAVPSVKLKPKASIQAKFHSARQYDLWLYAHSRAKQNLHKKTSICTDNYKSDDNLNFNGKTVVISSLNIKPINVEVDLIKIEDDPIKIEENQIKVEAAPINIEAIPYKFEAVPIKVEPDLNVPNSSENLVSRQPSPSTLKNLIKLEHNYNSSPQKLRRIITQLKEKHRKVQSDLFNEKRKVKRLQKKLSIMSDTVKDLKIQNSILEGTHDIYYPDKKYTEIPNANIQRSPLKKNKRKPKSITTNSDERIKEFEKACEYVREAYNLSLSAPSSTLES